MKKAGLIKYSEEWCDYHDKSSVVNSVINKSLNLEVAQRNEAIYAEIQGVIVNEDYTTFPGPIQEYMKNANTILLDYNNNAVNHNIDSALLYQEKMNATIDYILEDDCRYEEFVENWGVDTSLFY